MDDAWIYLCSAAALLTRFGLMLYLGGTSRAKNAAGISVRVVADLCVVTLSFWALGMAVAHPAAGLFHIDWSLIFGGNGAAIAPSAFRLLVVTALASGIVVGAVSERMRFFPALAASVLIGALLVPMLARWAWRGWLYERGYHDFAGASVIHLTGALCAATGAILVGPRVGKYNRDGSSNFIPGHSIPMAAAGIMLMLLGWLPYCLAFSSEVVSVGAGTVCMNVLLAGAAAGLASILFSHWRFGKIDIYLILGGLLGGLVSITASADWVSSRAAVAIGAVAGLLIPWVTMRIDLVWKVDDPSASIATHGLGGIWGVIAAGVFAPAGDIATRIKLIGVQAMGLGVIAATALLTAAMLFFILKRATGLRSKEADEFDGLDLAEHDIGAYPDFQQTTIKSYHLREA